MGPGTPDGESHRQQTTLKRHSFTRHCCTNWFKQTPPQMFSRKLPGRTTTWKKVCYLRVPGLWLLLKIPVCKMGMMVALWAHQTKGYLANCPRLGHINKYKWPWAAAFLPGLCKQLRGNLWRTKRTHTPHKFMFTPQTCRENTEHGRGGMIRSTGGS